MDPKKNGPNPELEKYRAYLTRLAREELDRRFQAKVDPSGVVNQTLYEANRDYSKVRDGSESAQLRWLRRILKYRLIDEIRTYQTQTRDKELERSLDTSLEQSSARLHNLLAAKGTSPSGAAVRNENLAQLAEALESLPEDQRMAVEYHHLQGLSLIDTADQMGKTKTAVAGLLYRGLNKLREELVEPE
ncbi:MAG: sigma-70 family RNA polymerase sigma factor [Planctomycetota bacterium]